jgi:hypothetical protein
MANVYKTLTESDKVKSRTLLHESIPITGTISSGTYTDQNIKNYAHKYFQSVYDYPYLSSSANHIFDITVGFSADSNFSGTNAHNLAVTASAKKINIYNTMAQTLVGYDADGNIRKFDRDGDFTTTADKMNEAMFICFSRLLVKDEIKKGSFTIQFMTGGTVGGRIVQTDGNAIRTLSDYGAATNYKVNSPAGEYGILYTSSAAANANSGVGLIYYQAGVIVLTASVFTASGPVVDFFDNNGTGLEFGNGDQTAMGADGSAAFTEGTAITASVTNSFVSATIQQMAEGVRNQIYNVQFNNTTELNSTIYFCRAHSSDFNYSTNPTYLSGSKIRVKNNSTDTPVAYISTVGLYSAQNELLAVAKVSEPLKKTPNNETTLRVRLDY